MRIKAHTLGISAEDYYSDKVLDDVNLLYGGSMELAPLVGLADAIVDLVSTGSTLKANNLREVEVISQISARLAVNQAALKIKGDILRPIIDNMARVCPDPLAPGVAN